MNVGERVKMIRKEKKLTQESFGERLGTTKNNISMIESGKNNLTEAMAKAICREFNVDYFWLTEGTGEMFISPIKNGNDLISELVEQYSLSEESRSILEAYITMTDEQRDKIDSFVDVIVQSVNRKEP